MKISSREKLNSTIEQFIETRDEYLEKADKYRDPDYHPSYAVSDNSDIDRDGKIEYWTNLARYYDRLIESEKLKIDERKRRKDAL